MKLWTAYLPCLGGFYASDAYVVAENRDQALERISQALRRYVDDCLSQSYYLPGVGFQDEESFDQDLVNFYLQAESEARSSLKERESAIIEVFV